jgi:crotonobetainyl-CoA:carnitine CoA-transferase CaiB-like acyl-CoA transferase
MPGPLDGIRVVDCSTVLAGPYATMVLGDLGADVIKVEPLEGDATRTWGPPWVGDEGDGTRTAAYYLAINRNKRSLRLDLRQEAGREALWRLLADADLVVENFKVDGFARLGFTDEALRARNPRLLHLAISGYGTTGPDAGKPGYDFVIQAASGLMSITGEPDGRPLKVGVAISDVVTGLFAAIGAIGGLLGRERALAGGPDPAPGPAPETAGDPGRARAGSLGSDRGAAAGRIDVSLLESSLALLVNQAQNAFVTGRSPGRRGNAHPSIVPYETFTTADGEIAIGVGSQKQWLALGALLGRPGLAHDPRFATNADRVEHREALVELLNSAFAAASSAAWLERLEAAGIPSGPILDVSAAFDAPQAQARGSRIPVRHPALGQVDQVASPIRFAGAEAPMDVRIPPPLAGEHSREILEEAGYSAAEIDRLAADGVI